MILDNHYVGLQLKIIYARNEEKGFASNEFADFPMHIERHLQEKHYGLHQRVKYQILIGGEAGKRFSARYDSCQGVIGYKTLDDLIRKMVEDDDLF